MVRPYMGTRLPEFADPSKSDFPATFAIYKGSIKKIDPDTRSGRVYVYIPEFGSDDSDDETNWTPVSYASPFGGVTRGTAGSGSRCASRRRPPPPAVSRPSRDRRAACWRARTAGDRPWCQ